MLAETDSEHSSFFLWNFFVSSHLTTARLLRFSCLELPQKTSFCVIYSLALTSQLQGCYGSAALNFHKNKFLRDLFVIAQFATVRFAHFLCRELPQKTSFVEVIRYRTVFNRKVCSFLTSRAHANKFLSFLSLFVSSICDSF